MNKRELTDEEKVAQKQALYVVEMAQLPGWEQVVKPWLEQNIRNTWLDPREFKSDEELRYAYSMAYARAQAAQEILDFVHRSEDRSEYYQKLIDGELQDSWDTYWSEKKEVDTDGSKS